MWLGFRKEVEWLLLLFGHPRIETTSSDLEEKRKKNVGL